MDGSGVNQQAAEAAPDVEQLLARLQAQLAADAIELVLLQVLGRVLRRSGIATRVGHRAVEKALEEVLALIVVATHVRVQAPEPVAQPKSQHAQRQTGMRAEPFVEAVPEQHRQQIGKRALLEREVAVHVSFAKPEIAEREHTVEHAFVADIDGDGGGHVQAPRDPHVGAAPDGDAGVGHAAVQQRQKQASRSDRRAVADPVMHESAPHRE